MVNINTQYRNKKKTTDVLSFPVHEDLRLISQSNIIKTDTFLLGDVLISYPVAKKQALSLGYQFKSN